MTAPSLAASATMPITPPRLLFAAALVALGDRLFYGHALGISVALFLVAVAATMLAGNAARIRGRGLPLAAAILTLGILPLVEDVGLLSVLFGLAGLALFAVAAIDGLSRGMLATLRSAANLFLAGPLQFAQDLTATFRQRTGTAGRIFRLDAVIGWAVLVLFCGLFAALFASANPLIEDWLAALGRAIELPRIGRLLLWATLLAFAWPFLAVRLRTALKRTAQDPAEPAPLAGAEPVTGPLLDATAIRRCLVMFNLLFAVQTILDVAYLWGGIALPEGMTYADYAHRGAYPLVLTALLAAGFVLAAMQPDGPGERSAAIRALVYLWIGQNVLLVGSAILRLDLYVATYSLTLLRTAAFIWMGLVALGLVLIVARIALRRPNAWLIGANAIVLAATLYVCAFVNFSALIADYNFAHSRQAMGEGSAFDIHYAMSLGPQAIPAIDRYFEAILPDKYVNSYVRDRLAEENDRTMADWRSWGFREWRLRRYLRSHTTGAAGPAPLSNAPVVD